MTTSAPRAPRSGSIAVATAGLSLLLMAASPAIGQDLPEQPGGLGPTSGQVGQSLAASLRLSAGWSRQSFADEMEGDPVRSGGHTSAAATVGYNYQGRRSMVAASATTSIFRGSSFSDDSRYAHSGSVTASRELGRRTTLRGMADIGYQPVNVVSLFPGMFDATVPIPVDYGPDLVRGRYLSYGARTIIEHALNEGSSVEGGASYRNSDWAGGDLDLGSVSFFGRYRREIAAGVSLRLGYSRGRGDYRVAGQERDVYTNTIDAGIDYARTLSVSRRTTLSFSTGTSAVSSEGRTRWGVVGDLSLHRQVGRTWDASAAYSRQAGFVDVLAEPAFTDALSLSFSGLLNRRASLSLSAGASRGTVGIVEGNEFSASHATAELQTSLTRLLGLQFSYIYSRYRFDSTVFLPADVENRVHQQSVLASVTIGVPLLSNSRTINVTR